MLDVKDLVEGVTKVKVLSLPSGGVYQKVGDVGTFIRKDSMLNVFFIGVSFGSIQNGGGDGGLYWFVSRELKIVDNIDNKSPDMSSQSEDLIIYKSRWEEIIENLEGAYSVVRITEEELEVVKSVLKNNTPFSIVPDLKVFDPVIEKEDQTHLDANYVGAQDNPCFYYRSNILKQWFYWSEDYEWGKCDFDYEDVSDLLPVSFGVGFGESK